MAVSLIDEELLCVPVRICVEKSEREYGAEEGEWLGRKMGKKFSPSFC